MDFKSNTQSLFGVLLLASCGPPDYGQMFIPEPSQTGQYSYSNTKSNIGAFSSSTNFTGLDESNSIMITNGGKDLITLSLDPFEFQSKISLPEDIKANRTIIGKNSNYYLVIGEASFAAVTPDGTIHEDSLQMLGNIKSIAHDTSGLRTVIQDSYGSFGFIKHGEDGYLEKTYKLGPLVTGNSVYTSGSLIPEGPLALATKDGLLIVVDVSTTLDDQTLSYKKQTLDYSAVLEDPNDSVSGEISWVSHIKGSTENILAVQGENLLTINTSTGNVIERQTVSTEIMVFSGENPHVFEHIKGTSEFHLFQSNESGVLSKTLVSIPFPVSDSITISYSTIDIQRGEISILSQDWGLSNLLRFRLSDSLPISVDTLPWNSAFSMNHKYILMTKNSTLGQATRWDIGREKNPEHLEGFLYFDSL